MEFGGLYIILAVLFGLYMTWGVGANDVANAMGTSVGSGAITVRKAILIAAVFEFAGAVLAGGQVTGTIRQGIISAEAVPSPEVLVLGMLAALLAAGTWLMIASFVGWPVSTTHTIVGALVGFGVIGIGINAVQWDKVGSIVASWFVSPLMGMLLAWLLAMSLQKLILNTEHPLRNAQVFGPVYVFFMGFLISMVTIFKGLKHLNLEVSGGTAVLIAIITGLSAAMLGSILIRRVREPADSGTKAQYQAVEKAFAPLCVFTACAMAFAHGSNDVANGIGPLAAVVTTVATQEVGATAELPLWILLLGGFGIVLGLVTLGHRVMGTIGRKITALTPSRGFCAELAAAGTVVVASRLGLPVSTTHIIVGAVMGVGLARGIATIDLRVISRIVTSWVITVPLGAVLSAIFFLILRSLFL
jgi:PiT family inorganic phosphate transporter